MTMTSNRVILLGTMVMVGLGLVLAADKPDDDKDTPRYKPQWRFDPMTGLPIEKPHAIPERTPKQVVLAFFKAYAASDRQGLADFLALEQRVADIMTEGVMKAEGLQPEMKKVIRQKLTDRATRVLVPAILDILISPEMKKAYPPPEDLGAKKLDAMFREEIIGDRARLVPSRAVPGASMTIRLQKIDDRWKITHLPGVMGD